MISHSSLSKHLCVLPHSVALFAVLLIKDNDPPNSQRWKEKEWVHRMDGRERECTPGPTLLSYPCAQTGCGTVLQPRSEPDYLFCSGSGISTRDAKQPMRQHPAPAVVHWQQSVPPHWERVQPLPAPPRDEVGWSPHSFVQREMLLYPNVRRRNAVPFLNVFWNAYGWRTWLSLKLFTYCLLFGYIYISQLLWDG